MFRYTIKFPSYFIKVAVLILLFSMMASCEFKAKRSQIEKTYYRAINGEDTAKLALRIEEDYFYGQYEVLYSKTSKDSGDVRGKVYADTLRGDYYYKPHGGGKWKRVPFALLRKDGKLLLGKGVAITYLGIPFYDTNVPISYDETKFTFEPSDKY